MSVSFAETSLLKSGPWHLDHEQLTELSQICEDAWRLLREEDDEEADAGTRSAAILLLHNKQVEDTTLQDALTSHTIQGMRVCGFRVTMSTPSINIRIELKEDHLHANIYPSRNSKSQQIFGKLNTWIETNSPSPILRNWRTWRPLGFTLLCLLYFFTHWLLGHLETTQGEKQWAERARNIVVAGINETNRDAALQAVLAIVGGSDSRITEDGSVTPVPTTTKNLRVFIYIFAVPTALAIIMMMIFAPPAVLIAAGDGTRRLRLWRKYYKFMLYGLPAFLFAQILLPWIINRLS